MQTLVRTLALALTTLTGFSGLVYEVAWQKYLQALLGSHSEATAAVLALFLGGLSIGYSLFGAITRRVVEAATRRGESPRLLLLYGAVEAGIGVSALCFPWLYAGVRALSLAIAREVGGLGFAIDVALAALLVLPPAVLMGGTIPILTQALSRSLADATRLHAHVYAFNTAGAFLGALGAGFVLIPWLGLERVVLAMGGINLGAGTLFGVIGLRWRQSLASPGRDTAGATPVRIGSYGVVALLAGFAAMAFQTVLIRVGGLSLGSSDFTFSMVVAVFVLCIALGSLAVSALSRIPRGLLVGVQGALAALMLLLYPNLGYAPYWAHRVRSWFRDEDGSFLPYYAAIFACSLAVLVIPIGLSGATLPLIFHQLKRETGGLGAAAGRLYSWNTFGSLLGALLGGYLLLFWLDLDQVYLVAVAAVVLATALLSAEIFDLPRAGTLAIILCPALLGLLQLPRWDPAPLAAAAFRMRKPHPDDELSPRRFFERAIAGSEIVFHEDDPNSSVAVRVARHADGPDPSIFTNGKPDGSIRVDYPTMSLVALLPALFQAAPERAFVVGYGTGVTVGELAALDSIQEVTVAEISPGVMRAARYFEKYNQGALHSPKTRVVVSDAYRALLRSEQQYDVIASEPSNPWVTGIEMLFSREFLAAARDRMRPGGVYAQWFHCYENDQDVVALVLRTYASVFDHVAVWYALGPDLVLLGFKDPSKPALLDLARLRRRFDAPDVRAGLRRAGILTFPELLAHEVLPLGVVQAGLEDGDVHTLLHPVLSHRAARAFYRGEQAQLPPMVGPEAATLGRERSLLQRFAATRGGGFGDGLHRLLVDEICESRPHACITLLAQWQAQVPDSPARERTIAALSRSKSFREHLEHVPVLAALFTDGDTGETIDPAAARRITRLYTEYFHYGAPFSRDALVDVWRRCRDGKGGEIARCQAARAQAERDLGPLRRTRGGPAGRAPG